MKKIISSVISVIMLASMISVPVNAADENTEKVSYNYSYDMISGYSDSGVHTRRMEKLDRGLIAIKSGSGVYLSWRLWDSEDDRYGSADSNVSFNVYRNGSQIATVEDSTNYTDTTAGTSYSVAPVIDGAEGEKCEAVTVMKDIYFDIPLTKPEPETIDEGGTQATKSFSPTDCSAGDLDGDGEYEIIVKWVSQEQDVGNGGYSGTIRFAAYKLDGTKLWDNDINLGKNVYSSAHTAQFLVYDFDGDGKSEMMVQTSLGSTDANGTYVSHSAKADSVVAATNKKISEYTDEENASADFNGYDRTISGEEFLTVFNGETGEAIDTIDLPTSRGSAKGVDYGDDFGNRSNRFIASVAYLDGKKPYAVYLRGYYFGRNGRQRTSIAGISFDGERLSPDYRFDTKSGQPGYYDGAYQYVGQGNHNCTVADVDNDGKDEFITGALCMEVKDDNTFKPRWCTYLQHGDALHIGDYDPTHKGFEFFTVHEDEGTNTLSGKDVIMDFGMSVIDADTGEVMFHVPNTKDTGRGVMANTGSGGYYQITGVGSYQCNGNSSFTSTRNGAGSNFRIFWDGDLYDELLDGTTVTNYNGNGFNAGNYDCTQINGTKANPALQADLFGDWREELVYPTTDGTRLRVFSTTTPTDYKIKTLMHDPVYRSGVAAEQTAYNQPPHVGFYMGMELFEEPPVGLEITSQPTKTEYDPGEQLNLAGLEVTAVYSSGERKAVTAYAVSGYNPQKTGEQTVTVAYSGQTAEFKVTVKAVDHIEVIPKVTELVLGEKITASHVTVNAVYSNGSSSPVTGYELSGYDPQKLGVQTVTVDYAGLTAKFKVTVINNDFSSLNRTYLTDSIESVLSTVNIGNLTGSFTLDHTVRINSMPANGNSDKGSTAGFFVRFMAPLQTDASKMHTGGGWYITNNNGRANIYWKSGASRNNATTIAANNNALSIGQTYTFKYDFTEVGTGNGAKVTLTILDENGAQVASVSNLNVRNFSDTDSGKLSPIKLMEIYNQAKSGSEASVTFANARITDGSKDEITSVDGSLINYTGGYGMTLYAAAYDADSGMLKSVKVKKIDTLGEQQFDAGFIPDKVFMWNVMKPVDMWTK